MFDLINAAIPFFVALVAIEAIAYRFDDHDRPGMTPVTQPRHSRWALATS